MRHSVVAGGAAYVTYPYLFTETEFHYEQTDFNKDVLERCTAYLKSYRPPFFLSGRLRQVLFQVYVCKDKELPIVYERTSLKLPDGGTVSVDWTKPQVGVDGKKRRVCCIFPGLSGGSAGGYIKSLVKTLLNEGFEVAVLHNRGVGNTPYTSPKFADLSRNEEIVRCLDFVRQEAGEGADLVGVGLSMGGNVMMRIAGELKNDFHLKAMVSVNNPFDIWLGINLMRGKVYEKYLAKELKSNLLLPDSRLHTEEEKLIYAQMIKIFDIDIERVRKAESWREIDEAFTIKVHTQFKCAAAYYNASSCLMKLDQIQVPTLVLHSRDDPIIPLDCVPIDECEANKNIITGITRRGAHCCYFMDADGKRRWYTHASAEFLTNALDMLEELNSKTSEV
jgi:uncharacterized protein